MLLITMNEVTNLNAYLRYFVPMAAMTIHAAGGQYLAAGEASSLSGQSLTRVVIVRFESAEQLHQWWRSAERQNAWKIGAKYARFRDIAVAVDVPPIHAPIKAQAEAGAPADAGEAAVSENARLKEDVCAAQKDAVPDSVAGASAEDTRESIREGRNKHLFSYAETNLFFLEREKKVPDAAELRKFGLSKRESEVLAWVAQGKTNGEIATILNLNLGTVKKHVEHIFAKLGVETRIAAAILALA